MQDNIPYSLFWLSAFLVAYPYIGYPALLSLISRLRPPSRPPQGELAFVSVIVAAYNEAAWITRKLESTLSQDYPADHLEVVVVSDGSTDRTAEIVATYPDPRVKLLVQNRRRGKSAALNLGVREARGEILIFTDANALFAPGAIRRLAEHFADEKVGLVSGQGLYGEMDNGTARAVANGYVRFEALIKKGESALGFVAGADGAIYALRRRLYRDLAPTHVNDLVHPLEAALAGYASRFEGAAYTIEPPSKGAAQELRRHVRIIAQGFSIFAETAPQLVVRRRLKELGMLCSHRLLRWISVLGLVGLISASLLGHGPLYRTALVAQGVFYNVAVAGWVAERMGWRLGLFATPYYFCVVSAAGLLGFLRFLHGGVQATWSPRGVGSSVDADGELTDARASRITTGKP